MAKHFLVELSTKIGVAVDDKEVSENLLQAIADKTLDIMEAIDLNKYEYKIKVIGQEGVK